MDSSTVSDELEVLRMQLAACGVVALADTRESAATARDMHEKYKSASCDDVARRVDECILLREQREVLLTALKEISSLAQSDGWDTPEWKVLEAGRIVAEAVTRITVTAVSEEVCIAPGDDVSTDTDAITDLEPGILDIVTQLLATGLYGDIAQDPVVVHEYTKGWSQNMHKHIRLFHKDARILLRDPQFYDGAVDIVDKFNQGVVRGVVDERALCAMRLLAMAYANRGKLNNPDPNIAALINAGILDAWKSWVLGVFLNQAIVLEMLPVIDNTRVYVTSTDGMYGNFGKGGNA